MSFDTLVTAPGSLGDVHPLLGIARSLHKLGRKVLFQAAEPYLPLAVRAGLDVRSLTSNQDFERLVKNPNIWHARRGPALIFDDMMSQMLDNQYAWLEANCTPGKTVLVCHMLDFAGRIYRDRYPSTAMATVFLAPGVLRSNRLPPRLTAKGIEQALPAWVIRAGYRAADFWIDSLAGKHINRLRRRIGLSPVSRIMDQWWRSPDLKLAMFPEWFVDPSLLDENTLAVGFPLTDGADVVSSECEAELSKILRSLGAERPILFAPGSANYQAKRYLQVAVEACSRMGWPAILLSPNPEDVPATLPANIHAARFLPFSKILTHCRAVAHHGGIGTTSQCMAAGVAQMVLPMAFDQFDNADRVQKLGCGSWFPMTRLSTKLLIQHLSQLHTTSNNCAAIAEKAIQPRHACDLAAEAILKLK